MPSTEAKLTRQQFNERFRLRECREQALVNCASCSFITGDITKKWEGTSQCTNPLRGRKVKILRPSWGDWNGATEMVCDAYQNRPLPSDVVPITFKEGVGALLNTQFRDCLHVDAKCPYVIEEQRLAKLGGVAKYNRKGEIAIVDITETVPGEVRSDACDMPCCESRLQFQISDPNTYRNRVGIHPNAHDPHRFVRNGITGHGNKSNMDYAEAEAFFGRVGEVASAVAGKGVHAQISAVSNYLYEKVNFLGSKPLSEATNPVFLWGIFHTLALPRYMDDLLKYGSLQDSTGTGADAWVCDERLFDTKKGLDAPLYQLRNIPEGIIPCIDSKGALRNVIRARNTFGECFMLHGILKPLEDGVLRSKGLTHFLDIRHANYHAHEHYWGESGVGFSATASFHEQ